MFVGICLTRVVVSYNMEATAVKTSAVELEWVTDVGGGRALS